MQCITAVFASIFVACLSALLLAAIREIIRNFATYVYKSYVHTSKVEYRYVRNNVNFIYS